MGKLGLKTDIVLKRFFEEGCAPSLAKVRSTRSRLVGNIRPQRPVSGISQYMSLCWVRTLWLDRALDSHFTRCKECLP